MRPIRAPRRWNRSAKHVSARPYSYGFEFS
jgi:hypothetical protein